MMVELVNSLTGGRMWVHETRVGEYLAAGHKLAAEAKPAAEKVSETDTKPKTTRSRKK